MGASCGGAKKEEGSIMFNSQKPIPIINDKQILEKYNTSNNIPKIIKIQTKYRTHYCQKNLKHITEMLKKNLLIFCDKNKLINIQVIKKSKSEQYYQKLLSTKKIKPFLEEYLKNNNQLTKQYKQSSKFSILINYPVVINNSQVYIGSYNINKNFHGYGIIYNFDDEKNRDSRTEGIFTNGNLNSFGRIILSSNEILIGDFALNKLNGFGEYIRNDGSIFKGTFFNGRPQGNGKEIFNDGSFFEGFYKKGKKINGKYVFKNGNFYQGFFENDLYDGEGIYKWNDGKIYEGFWKKGKFNGKGKIIFNDGSYYDGNFNDGKKEGIGKYFWNNKNYYEGEWKNDKMDGNGLYYKNGKKAEGIWKEGKLLNGHSLNSSRLKMSYNSILNGRFTKNNFEKNFDYGIRLSNKKNNNCDISLKTSKNENSPKKFNDNYYGDVIQPITKKIFNSVSSLDSQRSENEFVNLVETDNNNNICKNKDKEEIIDIK